MGPGPSREPSGEGVEHICRNCTVLFLLQMKDRGVIITKMRDLQVSRRSPAPLLETVRVLLAADLGTTWAEPAR